MDIALKKSEKATYNYTERNKIKQKYCHVEIIEQSSDQMHLKLSLNLDNLNIKSNQILVLEVLYRGIYFRRKFIRPKPVNDFFAGGFPENSNPSFRIKLLPENGEKGKIISATKLFKAKKSKSNQTIQANFFNIRPSESIGGLIWKIDWEDEMNPEILIQKNFLDKYGPLNNESFHVFILPDVLREILNGIFIRFDSAEQVTEGTQAYRWIKFCDSELAKWSEPDTDEWKDKLQLSELANQAALIFSEKEWDGKRTFLEKFMDKSW